MAEQTGPLFAPANFLIMTPRLLIDILALKDEWKGLHNQID